MHGPAERAVKMRYLIFFSAKQACFVSFYFWGTAQILFLLALADFARRGNRPQVLFSGGVVQNLKFRYRFCMVGRV